MSPTLGGTMSTDRRLWWPAVMATVVVALSVACSEPANPRTPDRSPSAAASPSAKLGRDLTTAIETNLENLYSPAARHVRAVLVTVDGDLVVERYWHSSPSSTSDVASVTKSVISTLIGIALSERRLRGLDQTLAEMLPAYSSIMRPAVAAITLRQLLTMTAGLPGDELSGGPDPSVLSSNWVRGILERGTVQPPGSGFAYASGTSHLLAAILEEATQGHLLRYAREKLFDPLGIDTRPAAQPTVIEGDSRARKIYNRAAFAWPTDPQGIPCGYGFMKLTAQDMTKLGNLYLSGGLWEGQQLIPARWVSDATRRHATTRRGDLDGYGYQWWTTSVDGHPAFAAIGYGGQLIEVVPELRLVVSASTSIAEDETPFDALTLMALVRDAIVPRIDVP